MTAPLALEGVRKSYRGRAILDGVSLEIRRGEVFAIVGPSGAGKTTTLRLLDLLEDVGGGRIMYDGRSISFATEQALAQRRRMAMIMQNPVAFQASAFDNVAYGLWLRGYDDAEIRARVFRALEFVGLLDAAKARADRMSGGEQQRIAFARAAVLNPEILFLDEFTANLDPANVRSLEEATLRHRDETGCTVVIVTHNLLQAKRLADRVGLLLGGRFVEVAPARTFFEDPATPEARAFVSGEFAF